MIVSDDNDGGCVVQEILVRERQHICKPLKNFVCAESADPFQFDHIEMGTIDYVIMQSSCAQMCHLQLGASGSTEPVQVDRSTQSMLVVGGYRIMVLQSGKVTIHRTTGAYNQELEAHSAWKEAEGAKVRMFRTSHCDSLQVGILANGCLFLLEESDGSWRWSDTTPRTLEGVVDISLEGGRSYFLSKPPESPKTLAPGNTASETHGTDTHADLRDSLLFLPPREGIASHRSRIVRKATLPLKHHNRDRRTGNVEIAGRTVRRQEFTEADEALKALIPKLDETFDVSSKEAVEKCHRLLDSLESSTCTVIEGETASGKSSTVLQVAARTRSPVQRLNMTPQTKASDLLGYSYVKQEGEASWIAFRDGVLTTAAKCGHLLVVEEANVAGEELLDACREIMHCGRLIMLGGAVAGQEGAEHGALHVTVHPNFRVVLTQNPVGSYGNRKIWGSSMMSHFTPLLFEEFKAPAGFFQDEKLQASFDLAQKCRLAANVEVPITLRDLKHAQGAREHLRELVAQLCVQHLDATQARQLRSKLAGLWGQELRQLSFQECLDAAEAARRPVKVTGPERSGKLREVVSWAERRRGDNGFEVVYLHPQSSPSELLDSLRPNPADSGPPFALVQGPISKCVQEGKILILAGYFRPELSMEWLNTLLESDVGGQIINIGGTTLQVHKDFHVVVTSTSGERLDHRHTATLAVETRFFTVDLETWPFSDVPEESRSSVDQKQLGALVQDSPFWEENNYSIEGREDVVRSVASELYSKKRATLEGDAACGKTSLARLIAKYLGYSEDQVLYHLVSADTDQNRLLGRWQPAAGRPFFKPGDLLDAVTSGKFLILDEKNHSAPELIGFIYAIMDPNTRKLYVPQLAKHVDVHESFCLVSTQNPAGDPERYPGCKPTYRAECTRVKVFQMPPIDGGLRHILSAQARARALRSEESVHIVQRIQQLAEQMGLDLRKCIGLLRRSVRGCSKKSFSVGLVQQRKSARGCESVPLHAKLMGLLPGKLRCTVKEEGTQLLISAEDDEDVNLVLICKLPRRPNSNLEDLRRRSVAQQELFCRMAFAHAYREPVILSGRSSFKADTVQLFHSLVAFPSVSLRQVHITPETSTGDLLGAIEPVIKASPRFWQPELQQDFVFQRGQLPDAAEAGDLLLLKHLTLADASVAEVLNAVTDSEPSLQVDGKAVTLHDRFFLVATVHEPSKALSLAQASRWTVLKVKENQEENVPQSRWAKQTGEAWVEKAMDKMLTVLGKYISAVAWDDGEYPVTTHHMTMWCRCVEVDTVDPDRIFNVLLGARCLFYQRHSLDKAQSQMVLHHGPGLPSDLEEHIARFEASPESGQFLGVRLPAGILADPPAEFTRSKEGDVMLRDVLFLGLARVWVAAIGPPGNGKSKMASVLGAWLGLKHFRLFCSAHLSRADFERGVHQHENGVFALKDSPAREVYQQGGVLVFEEPNNCKSELHPCFLAMSEDPAGIGILAMNPRRSLQSDALELFPTLSARVCWMPVPAMSQEDQEKIMLPVVMQPFLSVEERRQREIWAIFKQAHFTPELQGHVGIRQGQQFAALCQGVESQLMLPDGRINNQLLAILVHAVYGELHDTPAVRQAVHQQISDGWANRKAGVDEESALPLCSCLLAR
ncbi:unnamed protein product [Effrenium voratum]|nr:unnamed protein product [Effrenium voratum]